MYFFSLYYDISKLYFRHVMHIKYYNNFHLFCVCVCGAAGCGRKTFYYIGTYAIMRM